MTRNDCIPGEHGVIHDLQQPNKKGHYMTTYTRHDVSEQELHELMLFDAIRDLAKIIKDKRNKDASRAFIVALCKSHDLEHLALHCNLIDFEYPE